MRILRDRYVRSVVLLTLIVISVMLLLRRHVCPLTTQPESISPSRGPFRVTRVLDGDTVMLSNGQTVRLIGIDAPEIHHPEVPVQRFGQESMDFLKRLAEGFECALEFEPGNLRDKYDRLLAYVYIDDKLINAELIRRGYAYVYTRFPFSRRDEFLAIEREARANQYGLWDMSLRDGRITNLVNRYDSLNSEGRKRLDEVLDELVQQYPSEEGSYAVE